MKTMIAGIASLLISTVLLTAAEADRFVQKIELCSGQTAVVAEGDFEPRSTGSFSVRLYAGEKPQFPTDDFLSGVVQKRNGFVEEVRIVDVDGDEGEEIVVIVRCVGTGGFRSAHAFAVAGKSLVLRASVEDLAADAEPVSDLKKAKMKRK
jgi:hypothetical protein